MSEIIIDHKIKLILAVLFVILLLGIGTLLFHRLEQWGYLDSFYFSAVTLTTIGYGDLVPYTDVGKIVTSIFAILGVGTFLFALSVIAQNSFENRLKKFNIHPFKHKTINLVNGTKNKITPVARRSIPHIKKIGFKKDNLVNQRKSRMFERRKL